MPSNIIFLSLMEKRPYRQIPPQQATRLDGRIRRNNSCFGRAVALTLWANETYGTRPRSATTSQSLWSHTARYLWVEHRKDKAYCTFHKEQILKIRPSKLSVRDTLVWLKNPNGEYSTRSGYLSCMEENTRTLPPTQEHAPDWLSNVWNIKTSEKIKLFLWKSLHGTLPVGEQFVIRNIPVVTLCARCNEEESVKHLLFQCPYAEKVWLLAPTEIDFNTQNINSVCDGWERARKIPSLPPSGIGAGTLAPWICWSLWSSGNLLIFEKRSFTPEETIQKAITDTREWLMAQPTIESKTVDAFDQNRTKP